MEVGERDPVTGRLTTGHEWNGIKELYTPVPRVVIFFLVVDDPVRGRILDPHACLAFGAGPTRRDCSGSTRERRSSARSKKQMRNAPHG